VKWWLPIVLRRDGGFAPDVPGPGWERLDEDDERGIMLVRFRRALTSRDLLAIQRAGGASTREGCRRGIPASDPRRTDARPR